MDLGFLLFSLEHFSLFPLNCEFNSFRHHQRQECVQWKKKALFYMSLFISQKNPFPGAIRGFTLNIIGSHFCD